MRLKECLVWIAVFALNGMFLACGGGGGGDAAPAGPVAAVGVFKDSNVSGLAYVTSSGQSGVTDQYGRYDYTVGDSVTFSIGGVVLGSAAASGIVTPVDLVDGGSSSLPEVINIVRFLIMLDLDADPDNGITISSDVQTIADAWSANGLFGDDFETWVAPLISECETADGCAHVLPNAFDAQNHLEASLRCAYSGAFRGTFSGDDSGFFGVIVDPQTGQVRGAAYSPHYDMMTDATGTGIIDYDQTMAFITGFVDTGATFAGQLTSPNAMSGTWQDPGEGDHGSFSGSRIGGAAAAAYRYSGVFYNDDGSSGGVLAMDVNGTIITGVGYGIEDNDQFAVNGTLSGSTIAATISSSTDSNGVIISGTLYPADDTFDGTWYNPSDGDSGTFGGCGCPLN